MKRSLLVAFLLALLTVSSNFLFENNLSSASAFADDNYFGLPLCLPGIPNNGSCMVYGPAQMIAEMRAEGIPYPPYELPAMRPPSELNVMPVNIAKINLPDEQPSPVYGSFEDAVAESNPVRQVAPGRLRYVSFINRRDHQGKAFVQLASGGWTRAAPIAYTSYQGWEFSENPRHDFGWIVSFITVESRQGPSYGEPGSGNEYERDDQFFVYETAGSEVDDLVWYRIGHNEWVNSQMARVVDVNPTRPDGVDADRWIELNLFQQTIKVYEDGRLLFVALVATGVDPYFTQPGVFQIYDMRELDTMQGAFERDRSDFYYLEDVPWAIYYDQNRAIHATYWSFPYGYPQSHGCVNLSPGDARWIFEWAEVGDFVWVHDPSGQTPTNLDYYGLGAP